MGWAYHLGAWQRDKQKTELVKVELALEGMDWVRVGRGVRVDRGSAHDDIEREVRFSFGFSLYSMQLLLYFVVVVVLNS